MKFIILVSFALLALAYAAEEPIPIVRSESEVNSDSYSYAYETGNGIAAEEQGSLKNAGTDEESIAAQGQYSYRSDDGTPISVSYIADENGFQPTGDHIPVPPPIPEAILRALKYIAEHPPKAEILVFVALLALAYAEESIPIVSYESNINEEGKFQYSFETGDGTKVEQHGELKNVGAADEALSVEGKYSYKDPNGETVDVSYTADGTGYHPVGDVIPQIPEAIARSIKYNEEHPQEE